MTDSVRVGFLGAGLIAAYHSKSLRRFADGVEWSGVYDVDRGRAEAFAAASGAPVCKDEEGVLANCDAVYICTWTSEHRRLVEAAAARGVAIFCEKPLATDLAGAQAMTDAVLAAGVTNQVGLVLRSSPAFLMLRQVATDALSGRLMSIVFRDDQYIPTQGMYRSSWRGEVGKAGAGTLIEHSIHDIDMLEFIAGPVVSVTGRTAEFHGIPGIEDVCVATIAFANGTIASLTSVWHDLLARPSMRRVEVLCETAWCALEGDWFGPVRWTKLAGGDGFLEGEALVAAARGLDLAGGSPDAAFIEAVRAGRPASPDFTAARRAHVIVDAIYRSAASGGAPLEVPAGAGGLGGSTQAAPEAD